LYWGGAGIGGSGTLRDLQEWLLAVAAENAFTALACRLSGRFLIDSEDGAVMNFQTLVELRDPTLGKIFSRNWNLSAISEVRKIRDDGISADEYVARFFAAISRAVPEETRLNIEAFQAGNAIDYTTLQQLSLDRLDDLARAYLDETAKWMMPSRCEPSQLSPKLSSDSDTTNPQPNERQTERLRRLAKAYFEHSDKTWRETAGRLQFVLKTGLSPALKDAFTHTALLAGGINDAISNLKKPDIGSFAEALSRQRFGDGSTAGSMAEAVSQQRFGDGSTAGSMAEAVSEERFGDGSTAGSMAEAVSEERFKDGEKADVVSVEARLPFPSFNEIVSKTTPNLIYETNAELVEVSAKIRQLVEIGQHQAELSQALTQTSQLALQESINSGKAAGEALRQSRNAVWLSLATLILSVVVAGLSIWVSNASSNSTNARLESLITSVETLRSATSAAGASDSSRREQEIRTLQEIERQLRDMRTLQEIERQLRDMRKLIQPMQPMPSGGKTTGQ
jgi:hypothetical protein